ncbi:bifunctional riboflavin kinase/FAD synthetase [Prevotella sp. lc2012]|uniref:bifunctional riboflavin kinase/FAD synthetase n=1 Tax=Prevotella sp. lc2012 TaxID=1761886 RepID=UPI000898D83F|nr:bifunctional riboflavin kinase/FAD synthetase [Prevotella sp. lc2012]SEE28877.1 riboflavin kinase / FMN adenylyltransferase [Prevotella sp. lc2012]
MKTIWLNQEEKILSPTVATVGVFDGVHRGHQQLIGLVVEKARTQSLTSVVITFDRQPRQILDPTFQPQVLTTLDEKIAVVEGLGVDYFVVLPFTKETAALSARSFMQQILRDQLCVETLITGYDHRFGKNRSEGFDDYVRYGRELGMQVCRGEAVLMDGGQRTISSSVIRDLLLEGKVELMPSCLTRPYQLSGKVTQGEHIGRCLGFPTANLTLDDPCKLIPEAGVYAVWAALEGDGRVWAAMMNIGKRPTFNGQRQTLEVNLFDFEGDLYGQTLSVSFVMRLRAERFFDTPEALKTQLVEDRRMAETVLGVKER